MKRRFFAEALAGTAAGQTIHLPEAEAYHLRTVLRARDGDTIHLLDGVGHSAVATLLPAGPRRHDPVACRLEQVTAHPAPPRRITLCVAPPRSKAMDLLIRQATELGVHAIRPVLVERSESTPPAAAVGGWVATAREACKQSGNPWLPALFPAVALAAALGVAPAAGYIGAVPETAVALARPAPGVAATELALWIGPEGGFTDAEEAAIRAHGAQPLCLGPYILRVETAVAAGLALLQASCPP